MRRCAAPKRDLAARGDHLDRKPEALHVVRLDVRPAYLFHKVELLKSLNKISTRLKGRRTVRR